MEDGRGLWKQTKSGLRLAFSVVGVLIILGMLIKGLLLVRSGPRIGVVEGAAVIFLICVLAFVTTPRWAKWFFGVCCLMVLRGTLMCAIGRTVSVPSVEAPRIYFLEVTGLFALMALIPIKAKSGKHRPFARARYTPGTQAGSRSPRVEEGICALALPLRLVAFEAGRNTSGADDAVQRRSLAQA